MNTQETPKRTHRLRRAEEIRNIDDIKMRLMVNSMKIKLERQRLLTAVTPGATPTEAAMLANISRFDRIMTYATFGIAAFKMAKKAVDFFRSFKKSS